MDRISMMRRKESEKKKKKQRETIEPIGGGWPSEVTGVEEK